MTEELVGRLAQVKVPTPVRSGDETTSWRGIPCPAHRGHAIQSEQGGHRTSGGKQRFAQVAPVAGPCPPAARGGCGSRSCCLFETRAACNPIYLGTEQTVLTERVRLNPPKNSKLYLDWRFGVCW